MSSWRGGQLLGENIPVVGGRLTADVAQQVPERLTLTVANPGTDNQIGPWSPGDNPDHPLAANGQVLYVDVTITTGTDEWMTRLGAYLIQDWQDNDDGTVQVEAVGMLQVVKDDLFTIPAVPRAGGTFASEMRRLMSDGVPVTVMPGLVDRPIAQSFLWMDDRLGALYDLADAWPARIRTTSDGVVQIAQPLGAPAPVLTWTDGQNGTVVALPTSGSRDDVHNVIVARSSATDDPARAPVQAVETQTTGPFAVGKFRRRVRIFASPLLATTQACAAAARTILADSLRPARAVTVVAVPDPRVELDDPASASRAGVNRVGHVVAYSLPLVVDSGDDVMTVTIGVTG